MKNQGADKRLAAGTWRGEIYEFSGGRKHLIAYVYGPNRQVMHARRTIFMQALKARRDRGDRHLADDLTVPIEVAEALREELYAEVDFSTLTLPDADVCCDTRAHQELFGIIIWLVIAVAVAAAGWGVIAAVKYWLG